MSVVVIEAPPRAAKASVAVISWLHVVGVRRLVPSHELKAPPASATRGSSITFCQEAPGVSAGTAGIVPSLALRAS